MTTDNLHWISVKDELPITKPHSYTCEMSVPVLVKQHKSKNSYPFVAHLYKDTAIKYRQYYYGFAEIDGAWFTWLNPYHDIAELQKITHWMPCVLVNF